MAENFKVRRINRDDMLELTRRMTVQRNCLTRMAGCYADADGLIEDTFNISFGNLSSRDKTENLKIAKVVPFGQTNIQVKEYCFAPDAFSGQTMWKLLGLVVGCGLKNDVLMETFYEQITKAYRAERPYAVDVFHGVYDIPVKGTDGAYEGESEEIYSFMICTVGAVNGDYEVSAPDFGFLYPAFRDRSSDPGAVDIFFRSTEDTRLIRTICGGEELREDG